MPSRSNGRSRERGRKYDHEGELWEAVRAHCIVEFAARTGEAWSDELAAALMRDRLRARFNVERRAIGIADRLRAAVVDARQLVRSARRVGGVGAYKFLEDVVAQLAPLERRAEWDRSFSFPHDEPTVRQLVAIFGARAPFFARTERDFAVLSLLAGQWPKSLTIARGTTRLALRSSALPGVTVAEIIREERKAMAQTMKRLRAPSQARSPRGRAPSLPTGHA